MFVDIQYGYERAGTQYRPCVSVRAPSTGERRRPPFVSRTQHLSLFIRTATPLCRSQDYITTRRDSLSAEGGSGSTSPDARTCSDTGTHHFFSDPSALRTQRSNSKKFLRHDFAKAKLKKNFL